MFLVTKTIEMAAQLIVGKEEHLSTFILVQVVSHHMTKRTTNDY